MENSGGIQASLAGRYATALFGLARDNAQIDSVSQSLESLSKALNESADLKRLVSSPLVSRTDAAKVVAALTPTLALDPLTAKFVGVLA
ncbi:MAG: F0F1 ATP synthase subunit delta, partial [Pseudomonadota bacterium]|nr:F0F1 ATP synthase subunit delta [Pseudomonadota bacterium]